MEYTQTIREVIAASWFTLDPATYVYARVDAVREPERHLMVMRDGDEITVVTAVANVPGLGRHECNAERWRLFNVRCGRPFYCVGFIASIADAMARAGIDIVLASAFSNDLVMVMEKDLEHGLRVLAEIGFERRGSRGA